MTQNNTKRLVAITGVIGSGKSTVSRILQEKGRTVFSCDEINAELLLDRVYIEKIKRLFPTAVKNGTIDRNELGAIIFSDEKKREELNALAHPEILRRLQEKIVACKEETVFVEVPLLAGTPLERFFSEIVFVTCAPETRLQRICLRDKTTESFARQKIASQKADPSFPGKTVYRLENDGDRQSLIAKIELLPL